MKDLDKQAYSFIRDWPALVNFNPVYQEIDYSQIIRFYLWDKVGRALRLKNKGDNAEVTLYLEDNNCFPFYYTAKPSYGKYRKKSLTLKNRVFVPFLNTHTHELILDLKHRKDCEVLSKFSLGELEEENIIQEEKVAIRDDWYLKLFNALSQALELKGISLIPEDKELLKEQVKGAILISEMAEKELKTNKPNRLYVYSDNHPPFINYVLAAKKNGYTHIYLSAWPGL